MKAPLVALVLTALALPSSQAATNLPAPGEPVGCIDPDSLFTVMDAEQRRDVRTLARLMATRCRLLAHTHYIVLEQRNGVVTLRVFVKAGDWSSSWLTYTLDEMIEPEQLLPADEPMLITPQSKGSAVVG